MGFPSHWLGKPPDLRPVDPRHNDLRHVPAARRRCPARLGASWQPSASPSAVANLELSTCVDHDCGSSWTVIQHQLHSSTIEVHLSVQVLIAIKHHHWRNSACIFIQRYAQNMTIYNNWQEHILDGNAGYLHWKLLVFFNHGSNDLDRKKSETVCLNKGQSRA